jgi:sortase A
VLLRFTGNLFILLALSLLVLTFWPVVREEAKYDLHQVVKAVKVEKVEKNLTPPNTDFSIVIPKIEAVAPVFANIDSQDSKAFLPVLKKGVAHAKGTALPGQAGNTYLFAHSTDAFYNVGYYNAVFYLLGKLQKGDEIFVYYRGEKIHYLVSEVKVVDAKNVEYLGNFNQGNTLTLQTCYPPGTTLRRLVVVAREFAS